MTKYYSDEQIQQANNSDLADFVKSHGFECEKRGREIHVKGYGGLYINAEKNVFSIFSRSKADGSPEGGYGPLQFAQKVMGMSFPEAMREIVGEGAITKQFAPSKYADKPKEKIVFKMPEKCPDCKRVYAYLINQRGISPNLISEFIKQGILYQGYSETVKDGKTIKNVNAIFLHRNDKGQPCGAQIQGVNSFMRFKQNVAPDETDKGFVYNKGDPQKIDTVYIFEAPIDLMSFVQLHPEIENAKFVAMGGLKPSIAEPYINSDLKVISCVDNDKAGQAFNNKILNAKLLEALSSNGSDISVKTVDGEPPIEFFDAELKGREASIFSSREDYKAAVKANAEIRTPSFVWNNHSNFTVCRECAEAGVKDFNDLLKKTKSEAEFPRENTQMFISEVNKMKNWAEKAQEIAAERIADRQHNIQSANAR